MLLNISFDQITFTKSRLIKYIFIAKQSFKNICSQEKNISDQFIFCFSLQKLFWGKDMDGQYTMEKWKSWEGQTNIGCGQIPEKQEINGKYRT